MALNIVFKKVLNEDRTAGIIEYGDAIPFVIGTFNQPMELTSDYYAGYTIQGDNIIDTQPTNIRTLPGLFEGSIYQAFDADGETKLGFRLLYRQTPVIYNEEIGCILSCAKGRIFDEFYLVLNHQYASSTWDGVLTKAKDLWDNNSEYKLRGMDTNSLAIFNIIDFRYDGDRWTTADGGQRCINSHIKLRYFSSWYKMITGKFYDQEHLFSAELTEASYGGDSEHSTFYFGKILETSEGHPVSPDFIDGQPSSYNDEFVDVQMTDPTMVAVDLIYGSSPQYYKKYYAEALTFKNGMQLFYQSGNPADAESRKWAVASLLYTAQDETLYYLAEAYNHAENLRLDNWGWDLRPSAMSCVLEASNTPYIDYDSFNAVFGADIFVSPEYNDISAAEISSYIKAQEDEDFDKVPKRVLNFLMTTSSNITTDAYNTIYPGYDFNAITFAFTGNTHLTYNRNRDHYIDEPDTILMSYFPEGHDLGCTITKDIWAEIMAYEKPKEKPSMGGGALGGVGGKGTFDGGGDDITLPTDRGYSSSDSLGIWYIGDLYTGLHDEYSIYNQLKAVSEWISSISVDYPTNTKQSTVCSIKVMPYITGITGSYKIIVGIDGEPLSYQSSPTTTYLMEGVSMYQYQHDTLGHFSLPRYFDSYMDYADTEVQIYLPFSGIHKLNAFDIVGNDCELRVSVDWLSGNIQYNIIVDNGYVKTVVYTFSGSIGADIPLTFEDYNSKIKNTVNGIMGLVGSTLSFASGNVAGGVTSLATNTASYVANRLTDGIGSNMKGSNFGSNGILSPRRPYLIVTRPRLQVPDNFGSIYGWKTAVGGKLGSYTGMTVVKDCHIDNIPCLETEANEIENILKTGVIL